MNWVVQQLGPRGTTTRGAYWLAGMGAVLLVMLLRLTPGSPAFLIPIMIALNLVTLSLTLRRLRDAGQSPWIVLWFFFPIGITWDLATISLYSYHFHLIDVGAVLRTLPILIGLISPSRTAGSTRLVTSPAF